MTITLYYNPLSSPARCIINFLDYIKDDTVKRVSIDIIQKQQLEPWFIALNPHHTIPTLVDDESGITLYESTAILEYLAEKFDVTGKYGLPTDPKGKWATINALHNHHNFMNKAIGGVTSPFFGAFIRGEKLDLDVLKAGVDAAKPKFDIFEALLAQNGGYLTGSTPTAADVRPWSDIFQISNIAGAATFELYDFAESYPHIQKWLVAIKEDLFDEEVWAPNVALLGMAESVFGGPVFRLAKKD